ncbi:hypothetical protein D3C71_1939200 [compost metagenome]
MFLRKNFTIGQCICPGPFGIVALIFVQVIGVITFREFKIGIAHAQAVKIFITHPEACSCGKAIYNVQLSKHIPKEEIAFI